MPASSRWVVAAPKTNLVVGVADMVASNDGNAELVTYSLGSCLGVTVYDPVKKVGGLLHLMLPDSRIDPKKAVAAPFMFVDTGVPLLFKTVFNLVANGPASSSRWPAGRNFLTISASSTSASATSWRLMI